MPKEKTIKVTHETPEAVKIPVRVVAISPLPTQATHWQIVDKIAEIIAFLNEKFPMK